MVFYVYMLQVADGSLYTGQTKDLQNRLELHKNGRGSKYVRSRLPFKIVYQEEYETRKAAMQREIEIKKMSKTEKMKLITSTRNES